MASDIAPAPDTVRQELEQAREEAQRQEALKREEAQKELPKQETAKQAALDAKLESKGFTRADVHVFVDENGRRLPNAEKFADKEFKPEDASFTRKQDSELFDQLKDNAAKVLAGEETAQKSLVAKVDNIATALELAPEGIKFSPEGRPDFTPFAEHQVEILKGLTGDYKHDSELANKHAGISNDAWQELKSDYVWHHVEDGKTMQLIPRELHDLVKHTGGSYVAKHGPEAELIPASEQLINKAYEEQAYQQALARGASEENAQRSAQERTQLMIEQRALDAEQAKLTGTDKRETFEAVMQKQEDLRDARIAQEKTEAAREGRSYKGSGPLREFERAAKIKCDVLDLRSKIDLEFKITTFHYSPRDAEHYRKEREEYVKRTREEEQSRATRRQYQKDHHIEPPPPPSPRRSHSP